MSETLRLLESCKTRRNLLFAGCCAAVAAANYRLLKELLAFSLTHEFASMVPLAPILCAALIFRLRDRIFARLGSSWIPGGGLIVAGSAALMGGSDLSLRAAGIVGLVIGVFLACYGWESFREASFPLLMLLFMIPIPAAMLQAITSSLQWGSAQAVAILFSISGTLFHRQGLVFVLPGITIEVASQCSGIRSTMALFISCLLAGHLILRTFSRKLIFVLVAIPMAMLKNAIRIATLSLLAIHVDKGYLVGGDLHQRGGIVFFVLTLLLMVPVLWGLRRSEVNLEDSKSSKSLEAH